MTFSEVDTQDCDAAVGTCTETTHTAGGLTIVAQISDDSVATDRDTGGCTQGGVAMTRVSDNEIIGGNVEMDVFYMQGGSGDIVCTWAGTISGGGMISITYSGFLATGNPNVVAEDFDAANTVIQQSITTTVNNALIVDFVASANGSTSFTPDAGQTERTDLATGQLTMASSEYQQGLFSAKTMGQTAAASAALVYKIFAIIPSVSSTNSLGTDSLGVTS